MIVVHPVMELHATDGFSLWPVDGSVTSGFLHLHADLPPSVLGTAMMRIASCNDIDQLPEGHPPRPQEPLEGFLHGLLTLEELFVAGGMSVTDTATRTTLLPGCCSGLNEWRDWLYYLDGDGRWLDLGHNPSPLVERSGDIIRMTVDAEMEGGPVIEVPAPELRKLLGTAENELRGFLRSAGIWLEHHLPGHSAPLAAALSRSLDIVVPPTA